MIVLLDERFKGKLNESIPFEYMNAIIKFDKFRKKGLIGMNVINGKIFECLKNGVRIYYPDGVVRFINNNWEGEMFV